MSTGAVHPSRPRRHVHARSRKCSTSLGRAKSAFSPPRSRKWPTRASAIRSRKTSGQPPKAAARLQAGAAGGVLRSVPGRAAEFEDLRDAMAKLRLNDASFQYEMEIERRAGLRLPLRLSRAAAPRNHPRAAGARVQHRPDHHRAERDLPSPHDRRRDARDCTIRPTCRMW